MRKDAYDKNAEKVKTGVHMVRKSKWFGIEKLHTDIEINE